MKKLKVLLIAYNNLGKGGIQNQIMGIVRSLKDRVDFDIVVWDNAKDHFSGELEQYGVRIIRCFRNHGKTLIRRRMDAFIRYRDIRRIIGNVIRENGPYDVIHCNNAYDAAPCLDAAFRAKIPIRISHAHNTENPNLSKKFVYPAYQALYAHNRRKIHRFATHMIGCSRQVTDYFFGKDNGCVVHIGIDLSEFQNLQIPDKASASIELVHVGSMSEQKNQLFLVHMMAELTKLRSDVHLTMIGSGGSYAAEVNALIESRGLQQQITVMPPDSSVPRAMSEADLFVFPSTFEGFGIVLIEAQSMGLQCFVSDIVSPEANCGGLRYLTLHNGPAYWAEQIHRTIETGLPRRERYDVSEFSVDNMSKRIFSIYVDHLE